MAVWQAGESLNKSFSSDLPDPSRIVDFTGHGPDLEPRNCWLRNEPFRRLTVIICEEVHKQRWGGCRVTLPREREAILRCKGGDLAGLEVLFELHRSAVLRTAYAIVGSHHLAEDVTQEVFVELFTAIRRFDPERPFAPWLYRIVVNISLKELRRRDYRSLPLEEAAADAPSLDQLPDLIAEESEMRRLIWTAVHALRPKQRAAVVLRYYHGFSEAEMSVSLGCRRGTVKSRLHSAMRRLEHLLREGGTPETVLERGRDATS